MPNYKKVRMGLRDEVKARKGELTDFVGILHLVRELCWYPPIHRLDCSFRRRDWSFVAALWRNEPGSQQGVVEALGVARGLPV
jgi:hypothetical protein